VRWDIEYFLNLTKVRLRTAIVDGCCTTVEVAAAVVAAESTFTSGSGPAADLIEKFDIALIQLAASSRLSTSKDKRLSPTCRRKTGKVKIRKTGYKSGVYG
jgi:hypothetical protein